MRRHALVFCFVFFGITVFAGRTAAQQANPETKEDADTIRRRADWFYLSPTDCSSLAVSRITENVDDEVRTPLKGSVHPLARAEFDLGRVDDNLPMEHIIMILRRSSEQELALTTHIDEMHNRRSPRFHQWLSAEQFGACYGVADSDIAVVSAWLESHRFRVDEVPAGRMSIIFSGTGAQLLEAFHTEIHMLNVKGRQHIANMTSPEVPRALAPVIAGFRSLHDFFPQPTVHVVGPVRRDAKTGSWKPSQGKDSEHRRESSANGNSLVTFGNGGTEFLAVGPQDFYTIYNENPLLKASTPINGAGQTLAVIEPTDINKADVTTFRSQFGLPAYPATPNSSQGGVNWIFGISGYCNDPGIVKGNPEGEADIDVDWIGTTAPAAIINFVACADTMTTSGVDLAGTYVVNHLASSVSAISVSYGVCEAQLVTNSTGFQTNSYYNALWQQAVAQGQTVVVSAGDSGDDTCDRNNTSSGIGENGISVNGISSTPYNVSAGGTDFSDVYSNGGTIPTPYWNSNDTSPYGSALRYPPEMAWNNSCGSLVAAASFHETAEQLCNISGVGLTLDGGGGGISTVYSLPTWQSVYGVGLGSNFTASIFRNLPDLSFFASDGLFWNHVLLFCESDTGFPCNYAVGSDAAAMSAGGTSFVAPMLTGLIALINQAHPSGNPAQPTRQGQANYTFYALANTEYGTPSLENISTTKPSVYTCESNALALSTYSSVAPNCIFHNVNRTPVLGTSTCVGANNTNCIVDDNVQPCVSGTVRCFNAPGDLIGLLSASTSTFEPAFPQSAGYNAATGLGSFNIANLVNGWKNVTTTFASTTTLAANPPSISVSGTTTLTATVTATARGSLAPPLGTVTFYAGTACSGTSLGTSALTPASGHSTASLPGVTGSQLGGGGIKSAVACFSGDGANDAASSGTTSITVNMAASTTTTVTSSANPSVFSQSVTFTASVSSGSGTPTGMVTFKDGTTTIGTVTLSAGVAKFAISTLGVGGHSITAVYSGDSTFSGSTSSVLTQTVNQSASTTLLASSVNPSVFGQSVSFTATVNPTFSGTPTGTVTFKDGTTTLGTASLTTGKAVFTTAALAVASHSITAVYGGSSNFLSSTSSALTQFVHIATSSTTLTSSVNPSVFGESVTFTATVKPQFSQTPTGTVTFKDGSTTLATVALSSGKATLSTSTLAVASHSVTAAYGGSTSFSASTSTALTQTVKVSSTSTLLASSANPSVPGQSVTFAATVKPAFGGTPTGSVTFKDGSTTLATMTLSSAKATFTISSLALGSHFITAAYGGSTNYTPSTSSTLTQTVNVSSTTTTVTSSANPSVFGQSVTFTATVKPAFGTTPTGTVTFKDGSATLGSATLSSGKATLSTSTLAVASHSVTAAYGGSTDDSASTSSALVQAVHASATSTSVSSSLNPSTHGTSVTFTATVKPAFSGTPTGLVTFKDGATTLGTVTLSGGKAAFGTSTLATGKHSITAVYGGSASYLGSMSSVLTQTVN